MHLKYLWGFVFIVALSGCDNSNPNEVPPSTSVKPDFIDTIFSETVLDTTNRDAKMVADSIKLTAVFNEEDEVENDYLLNRLKPIRANFKRINTIPIFTSVIKKDLRESAEGGEAMYYFQNKQLEKVVTQQFGETSKSLTEYYLLNGKLSFVFNKYFTYSHPISSSKNAINISDWEIVLERSYFENGKLIHQINNQDCGAPFTSDYLQEEQKRIQKEFEKLLKLINSDENKK